MPNYEVGDVFLRRSPNMLGWAIRTITRSSVNHTGVVVAVDQDNPIVIEALWRGAIIRPFKTSGCVFYRPDFGEGQISGILSNALMVGGVDYGYLDVIRLGMAQFKPLRRLFNRWLTTNISNPNKLFCSQLCDRVLMESGYQIFDDGRLPQDVTPGDILKVANQHWSYVGGNLNE